MQSNLIGYIKENKFHLSAKAVSEKQTVCIIHNCMSIHMSRFFYIPVGCCLWCFAVCLLQIHSTKHIYVTPKGRETISHNTFLETQIVY